MRRTGPSRTTPPFRHPPTPSNFYSWRPACPSRRPNFPSNCRGDRPPDPLQSDRSNFVVVLYPHRGFFLRAEVETLIDKCRSKPEKFFCFNSGSTAGKLFFQQWSDALEAIVSLWELRFDGEHNLLPTVIQNVIVPSDRDELNDRLKDLFVERIRGFMAGELVRKWETKLENLQQEITGVKSLLRKPQQLRVYEELSNKKKGLVNDSDIIAKRIEEFKAGLCWVLDYLEGKKLQECGDGVPLFMFKGGLDWGRIYHIVQRECRRLDGGLPIYAFRREILRHISRQQIMVLIGETGSGKSTQLVQFLTDSGVATDGSVICTQPRKIAAISLAQRVQEESSGCYGCNAISCCPSYSSAQQFAGKVIYMTDHCLLQHCMNGKTLSGISCIIVDEAHERSLNTDLLLALVKKLLCLRMDLRLIIMSATADANQLSDYFFGCQTFKVVGRNFPVDIKYVPCIVQGTSESFRAAPVSIAPYVPDVVRMAKEIHKTEPEGTILAFLTSPLEVEWACESFLAPHGVALPLHGKLSFEEQSRVFQDYLDRRKVIFATNVAETSLTIPGVKYVVDSGMAKESRFEPTTGMNALRVCWISKSSADQRAGRAGRTEPGRCYRLYSQDDYDLMLAQQDPEIRRVHLGMAVLKILALGVKNVEEFDFVDAPSSEAIDMAIRSLIQLGAVRFKNDVIELTEEGRCMVKLGIEPRLGKLVLGCFHVRLCREGLVLAAVMANCNSIFCRVGSDAHKLKSDRLKVPFCHRDGDLFTFLSVYKEWESVPWGRRNKWCWENSINAKSMRRCHDAVAELENCLKTELFMIIPSYWYWKPDVVTEHDRNLKRVILASLAENVAMFSGYDQLGYRVALTGQHVQLHPSCSLLMFSNKPSWVVFGEILSASNQYLVCVTAFDVELLSTLSPPSPFDVHEVEVHKLHCRILSGFGSAVLKKFCGKANSGLISLVSRTRMLCGDERIGIEVDIAKNEIQVYSSSQDMEVVLSCVKTALDREKRWLDSECMEKFLHHGGPGVTPPVALFGAGAEIKHLELDKKSLSVDVFCSEVNALDDKELIMFFEENAAGICAVHKCTGHGQESEDREKWGSITFVTPDAARRAAMLDNVEFCGLSLRVQLSGVTFGVDRAISFPAVKAKVYWPRRYSKGIAIVKCDPQDIGIMLDHFSHLQIGDRFVRCEVSSKFSNSVMIYGIGKEISEPELSDALSKATYCKILDLFLLRGDSVDGVPWSSCEEALFKQISLFMPKSSLQINCCRVQVFPPEPKEVYMKALITFDGRLHLEAAKALEQIEGKALPGCLSWQKIKCQRLFQSSVSCSSNVYFVIKRELDALITCLNRRDGTECILDRNHNGSFRVKISATATKTVAEMRRPLEQLMKGKTVSDPSITPSVLQVLFSREGVALMLSLQLETRTHIFFDRQNISVRIFGPSDKVAAAEEKLIQRLLSLHEKRHLVVPLRGDGLPNDLMKEVVKRFGPDLEGLKDRVPGTEFTLNTRRHVVYVHGDKEAKRKVEEIIYGIAQAREESSEACDGEITCPICLCEVDDKYQLERCMHSFCRLCLVEQCESAIRSRDSFPICCAYTGCGVPIWLTDLKSLLSTEKLEELFRASIGAFVASSGGIYRFCPSPDCPSVYRVANPGMPGEPFVCGACYVETCNRCHLEYHPYLSCEMYMEYKEDPDSSLKDWCTGKEHVKSCPVCGYTIEKIDGCNHIECKCGRHICWVCLDYFLSSDDCYSHLRSVHQAII